MLKSLLSFHSYAPIQIQLVFCPSLTLAERWVKRNEEAKQSKFFSNMRDNRPFWQYTQLYKPKSDEKEEVLEILNRNEVCRIFDSYLSEKGESPEEQEAKRNNFLFALGFCNTKIETVAITSRFKFHTRMPVYNHSEY